MTTRRYQLAFFALGWLLLIGFLVQRGLDGALGRTFAAARNSVVSFGQSLSDREADARQRVQSHSRKEDVARAYPLLTAASLRNPSRMLYGAYDGALPDSFNGVTELESKTGEPFAIISIYQAWGDRPDETDFPLRAASTIDRLGSIPMITWEPWMKDFDAGLRTNLPSPAEREYASLAAIAHGDYDFYVTRWAASAAQYGKPIFLRFAHEMNDPYRYPWGPQNGNRPDDFIAAWKHVHLIFAKMNATNVLWVWSPHISMPWFEYYYPGDEWVDWIGTGVLNYGDTASWSRWWTFHQIIEKAYPALLKLHKPIMIGEFGSVTSGGDAARWYEQAFRDIHEKYGAIRAVIFFNQTHDVTLSTTPLNWSATQDAGAMRAVARAMQPPNLPAR
ncbi:MAG: hypothetical protein QOI24_4662 [Acidobacteriota bacterium]|jgi:hypothetical protein|nr:hypothetical protein [Acidobacteriota bacterium]